MFLRRALRYRWAQALVLTGVSLLIGTCAVFGPWFARAVEQTVMTETLAGQPLQASWLIVGQQPSVRPEQLDQLLPADLCAVAVGIATMPGLLLADEPTSQLDHHARDEVLAALRTINSETGMTVLLVTHDPEVAATLPRTITIRDGRIASEGRSGEEYAVVAVDGSLPLPPHVAELLPAGTLVQVTTDNGKIQITPVLQEGDQ